jgi:hypothetical protein
LIERWRKLNAGDGVKILICYLHNMERGGKVMVVLLSVLALTAGTQATRTSGASSSDGPYRAIMDRNVFDLRPMPAPASTLAQPTPPPNVKLVGVMMITGYPQAVLSIADPTAPTKPPVSYVLSEGQRQASVEVKSINMDAKTARVLIAGDVVQLKLEEVKAAAGPAPAAAPGMAGQPGQGRFVPGARGGGRGAFPVPAPGGPTAAGPGYNPSSSSPSASYQPGVSPDNSALPTRPVRTDATDPSQDAMTPEQSLAQVEQTRQFYQQNNDPRAQLLPPFPGATQTQQPSGGDTAPGGQQEQPGPTTPQFTPPGSRATGSLMPH